MSRQISRRYLLFCLSVSVIFAYGSSRRIPRGASCPSCSQDCPEALTVQLPWNPRQKSNLRDFSINPLQNFPHSHSIREGISQDITRDDNVPLNQNSMSFGNYRRFYQEEPMSKNLFFKNDPNNSPKFLDGREIFSHNRYARVYPHIVPSRQIFDRSENLFFRNPRNKNSESLSEDYKRTKDYKEIEEDPMSKVLVAYRADRDTKPSWKDSRDTFSSNVMQSEKFFPKVENIDRLRRGDILDEERNALKKSPNSASQFNLRERYNPIRFGPSEIKREPYVKDTDIPKSTKEFFGNWDIAKDSSQSSNLEQFRNNLLEVYPVKKQEIIAEDDNEQINSNSYNSKFPQDLNIWTPRKESELFDSPMTANTNPFENEKDDEDMKEYFEDKTEDFMDAKDMKEYFEDETEQDTIETGGNNYNSHVFPQNMWEGIEDEEFLDDLDFMRENSQETGQLGLYSEENNKHFQDEQKEDVIVRDKAYTSAEIARAPVINAYNAYILPRYLNIVNDKKNSAKSETQELSEAKSSIRENPVKEMDHRFFEDDVVTEDTTHIQDLTLPKDIFDVKEYSNPFIDKRNNVRNKNEALTELDPDLLYDIENPPVATTETTPT